MKSSAIQEKVKDLFDSITNELTNTDFDDQIEVVYNLFQTIFENQANFPIFKSKLKQLEKSIMADIKNQKLYEIKSQIRQSFEILQNVHQRFSLQNVIPNENYKTQIANFYDEIQSLRKILFSNAFSTECINSLDNLHDNFENTYKQHIQTAKLDQKTIESLIQSASKSLMKISILINSPNVDSDIPSIFSEIRRSIENYFTNSPKGKQYDNNNERNSKYDQQRSSTKYKHSIDDYETDPRFDQQRSSHKSKHSFNDNEIDANQQRSNHKSKRYIDDYEMDSNLDQQKPSRRSKNSFNDNENDLDQQKPSRRSKNSFNDNENDANQQRSNHKSKHFINDYEMDPKLDQQKPSRKSQNSQFEQLSELNDEFDLSDDDLHKDQKNGKYHDRNIQNENIQNQSKKSKESESNSSRKYQERKNSFFDEPSDDEELIIPMKRKEEFKKPQNSSKSISNHPKEIRKNSSSSSNQQSSIKNFNSEFDLISDSEVIEEEEEPSEIEKKPVKMIQRSIDSSSINDLTLSEKNKKESSKDIYQDYFNQLEAVAANLEKLSNRSNNGQFVRKEAGKLHELSQHDIFREYTSEIKRLNHELKKKKETLDLMQESQSKRTKVSKEILAKLSKEQLICLIQNLYANDPDLHIPLELVVSTGAPAEFKELAEKYREASKYNEEAHYELNRTKTAMVQLRSENQILKLEAAALSEESKLHQALDDVNERIEDVTTLIEIEGSSKRRKSQSISKFGYEIFSFQELKSELKKLEKKKAKLKEEMQSFDKFDLHSQIEILKAEVAQIKQLYDNQVDENKELQEECLQLSQRLAKKESLENQKVVQPVAPLSPPPNDSNARKSFNNDSPSVEPSTSPNKTISKSKLKSTYAQSNYPKIDSRPRYSGAGIQHSQPFRT